MGKNMIIGILLLVVVCLLVYIFKPNILNLINKSTTPSNTDAQIVEQAQPYFDRNYVGYKGSNTGLQTYDFKFFSDGSLIFNNNGSGTYYYSKDAHSIRVTYTFNGQVNNFVGNVSEDEKTIYYDKIELKLKEN